MKASKQITLQVYDTLGKNVFESVYKNVAEGQKEMITLSGIPAGTYYIRLRVNLLPAFFILSPSTNYNPQKYNSFCAIHPFQMKNRIADYHWLNR